MNTPDSMPTRPTMKASYSCFKIQPLLHRGSQTPMQAGLLALLDTLQRERLEPASLVEAFALEHRGSYRGKLKRLAHLLHQRTPLLDALEQVPGVVSDEDLLELRLGNQSGMLSESFADLAASHTESSRRRGFDWMGLIVYWWIVGMVILLSLGFLAAFISPTFKKLMWEMNIQSDLFGRSIASTIPIVVLMLLWFSALILLGFSQSIRNVLRRWFASWLGNLSMQKELPGLLRMLALTVDRGRPISGALSTLAKYHHNSAIRQKLLVARNEIEQGMDDWDALQSAGLLNERELESLHTTNANASRAWILRQFSSTRSQSQYDLHQRWSVLVNPAIAIVFGLVVGWLCFGVIGSLYGLVQSLS